MSVSTLPCGHPNAGLRGPNGECMIPFCATEQNLLAGGAAIVDAYMVGRITGDWSDLEIVAHALPACSPAHHQRVLDYILARNA